MKFCYACERRFSLCSLIQKFDASNCARVSRSRSHFVGWFETELTAPPAADKVFVARINDRVSLRLWGKPRDLAGVAIFLASDAASYISAQQIVVDGGLSATM